MSRMVRVDFIRVAFASVVALLLNARGLAAVGSDDANPFGVGSSAQASGLYASWMPKMAVAGVKWVRIFPEWNQIQPSAGTWNWSQMDSMLNTAASNRLTVSG